MVLYNEVSLIDNDDTGKMCYWKVTVLENYGSPTQCFFKLTLLGLGVPERPIRPDVFVHSIFSASVSCTFICSTAIFL